MGKAAHALFFLFCFGCYVAPLSAEEPHWAKEEGFGLLPERESPNGPYVITTFIPRSLLLYDIDYAKPDELLPEELASQNYAYVTTQDDVKIFMLEDNISRNSFAENRGKKQYIFNFPESICRTLMCNRNLDQAVWHIYPGESFEKVVPENAPNVSTLRGYRHGEEIVGYINNDRLDELVDNGFVTRSHYNHPRYRINWKRASFPNTECDKKIAKDKQLRTDSLSPIDQIIIEKFGIGQVDQTKKQVIFKTYGGAGKVIRFRLYDVTERKQPSSPERQFQVLAAVEYACERTDFFTKMKNIRKVTLKILKPGHEEHIELSPLGTPDGLVAFTKSPYLWSVNSYEQYKGLVGIISEKLKDKNLASFFISEFNRSCPGEHRKSVKCSRHEYPPRLGPPVPESKPPSS